MSSPVAGRDAELAAIDAFLDALPSVPAALLLEGEPGIGKTTLWNEGVVRAADLSYRVLSARPSETETGVPFAALGDLLADVPEEAFSPLPSPQRRAMDAALLRVEAGGPPPLRHAVSLGLLGVLRALGEDGPLLVAVDDLHWLDRSSAHAIEFAARRVGRGIGVLATQRSGETDALDLGRSLEPDRVRLITVGPLEAVDLGRLVLNHLGIRLTRRVLAQLERVTGGNPFFALEMARAIARDGPQPGVGEPLPMPRSLRDLVRERLVGMPAEAREVALLAAALSQPSAALVEAAAAGGPGSPGLARAVGAGVVELDGDRLRLSHPLLGSVLYSETPPAARRELHGRLAGVVGDPQERARHLALAAEGPDPDVAAALDAAAERARSRGAPEAAAELLEQAGRLTPRDRTDEGRRRGLRAAQAHLEAGDLDRARSVLEELIEETSPGPLRAEALLRLAWVLGYLEPTGFTAMSGVLRQALEEAGDEPRLRVGVELGMVWTHHRARQMREAARHARLAVQAVGPGVDRVLEAQALATMAFFDALLASGDWRRAMARALELEDEHRDTPISIVLRPRWLAAVALSWSDELDEARSILEPLLSWATDHGDIQPLPHVLVTLARIDLLSGAWDRAHRRATEGADRAAESGQLVQRLWAVGTLARVEAHRGNVEATLALAEEIHRSTGKMLERSEEVELRPALGLLELSLGRPDGAIRWLEPLHERTRDEIRDPGVLRTEPDLIEALIETGRLDDARATLGWLDERATALERASTLAAAARCRGLLLAAEGDPDAALPVLEQALGLVRGLGQPFELGRTLLAIGKIQRRRRRWKLARSSLESALEVFEDLGARLWSARGRDELARIGGRAPEPWGLTPTEERLARLVSEGRTNAEAAAALSVSVKTVEGNLTRIYRKLGVRSRAELTRVVLEDRPAPVAWVAGGRPA